MNFSDSYIIFLMTCSIVYFHPSRANRFLNASIRSVTHSYSNKLIGVAKIRACNLPIDTSTNLAIENDVFSTSPKEFKGYFFEYNFDRAMVGLDKEKDEYLKFISTSPDKVFIDKLKNQYAWYVDNLETLYTEKQRIPKIIHQIWVGPHPFPQEALEWQATWKNLHPDWEYKLWTNADVEALEFENKKYYDQAENWGEKADILRLELLHQFGGLYVDVDQKCFKSFDVLHHTCDFYVGIHQLSLILRRHNKLRIANGVIAAVPGHPIIKHAVDQIKNNRHHKQLLMRAGPDYFTKIAKEKFKVSEQLGNVDVFLPANYFYPYGQTDKKFQLKPDAVIFVKPETLAVHYYTSYWVKPPVAS